MNNYTFVSDMLVTEGTERATLSQPSLGMKRISLSGKEISFLISKTNSQEVILALQTYSQATMLIPYEIIIRLLEIAKSLTIPETKIFKIDKEDLIRRIKGNENF